MAERKGMSADAMAELQSSMSGGGGIRSSVRAGTAGGVINGDAPSPIPAQPQQAVSPMSGQQPNASMQAQLQLQQAMQQGMQGMPSMGMQGTQPAQPVQAAQPVRQAGGSQQALRNRMRAEQNGGAQAQPVTMTQTADYRPTGTQQTGMPNQPNNMMGNQGIPNMQNVQQMQQQQPPMGNGNAQQATSTIINTTMTDGIQQGDNGGKKFHFSKASVFIIVAVVMALLLLAYFLFGGDKAQEEEVQPVPEEELEWLDPVGAEVFLYTPEEIDALRTAGYTGTEIEEYQTAGKPAQDLIDMAEAKRDAWLRESVVPLYDMASDEYKHQVSQTWLTLPQRTDAAEWTMLGAYYTERKNLDYEKIDVYGNQLFLKVFLDDSAHEDWFFLCVTPEEWNKLNDNGNVIVNYTYCTHLVGDDYFGSEEDKENIYITQASLEIVE